MEITSENAMSLLFCFISSCFLVFITARFRRGSRLTVTLPPGPPRLPFIGNIHQVGKNPHRSFADLSKTYGPVISLNLGSLKSVVITSPEAAREVLRTHDQILSARKSTDSIRSVGHHEVSVIWLPASSARWRYTNTDFIFCDLFVFEDLLSELIFDQMLIASISKE